MSLCVCVCFYAIRVYMRGVLCVQDPRKKAPLAGSSGSTRLQRTPPVAETRRGKKKSLHSPRRPLSSRSSLSPGA